MAPLVGPRQSWRSPTCMKRAGQVAKFPASVVKIVSGGSAFSSACKARARPSGPETGRGGGRWPDPGRVGEALQEGRGGARHVEQGVALAHRLAHAGADGEE